MLDPGPAIGGDYAQFGGVRLEQPRHEPALAGLEIPQYLHFFVESLLRVRAVVSFIHPAIETDLDGRPECILHLQHAIGSVHCRRTPVK